MDVRNLPRTDRACFGTGQRSRGQRRPMPFRGAAGDRECWATPGSRQVSGRREAPQAPPRQPPEEYSWLRASLQSDTSGGPGSTPSHAAPPL